MGQRVLVTGGAGFIGSHLVDVLMQRGDHVVVFDNFSTGNPSNLPSTKSLRIIIGDVRKHRDLDNAIRAGPYDTVFHLAAQTSVSWSVAEPHHDFAVNYEGSCNVATRVFSEAVASKTACPHFVFASSAAVYGSKVTIPTPEESLCNPESPYGENKYKFERVLQEDYAHGSPDLLSSSLRFGNVYGPRQSIEGEAGVIALFTGKILHGQKLTIYGNGNQTRDFVYVGDVVSALVHAGDRRLTGAYNVSTSTQTSVNDLVRLLGDTCKIVPDLSFAPARQGDILHSCLDTTKLRATGWAPRVSLQEGLAFTEDWIKRHKP